MENDTPKSLGYNMPAEWEQHDATWITFPHNDNTWPERLEGVQKLFGEEIAHISMGERVDVFVQNQKVWQLAESLIFAHSFAKRENVVFHELETMDSWIRDYGPTFVVNRAEKKLAMVHWIFNAWGEKYEAEEPLSNDKVVPLRINEIIQIKRFEPGIVMEGGSIEVDGKGTVITSEQCLLNKNRNPKLNRKEIEDYLKDYLNVEKVIWVGEGIEGDDTDGHIDDMVRFFGEKKVLCVMPNRDDANFPKMRENFESLQGAGFEVTALPMPKAIYVDGGKRRLPASYANFYIANAVIIVPVFNDENDKKALDIIAKCFPDRHAVGLYSTDVVYGFGSWHCLSQQQPKV